MSVSDIQLKLGMKNSVVVDGQDITDSVNFVGVQHEPGQTLPILTLGIKGGIELEGDMEVSYVQDATLGQMMSAFFSTLDPEKIMNEALEDEDVDKGVCEAIMRVLERKAP